MTTGGDDLGPGSVYDQLVSELLVDPRRCLVEIGTDIENLRRDGLFLTLSHRLRGVLRSPAGSPGTTTMSALPPVPQAPHSPPSTGESS